MDAADSLDPYFSIPGLDVFLGQEMIAEVAQNIPYLQKSARLAEFGFRVSAGRGTGPLIGDYERRVTLVSLASVDALDGLVRPELLAGPFVIEVWLRPRLGSMPGS